MTKRKRLIRQLYPSYLLIITLTITAALWFSYQTLRRSFLDQTVNELTNIAHIFKPRVINHLSPPNAALIDRLCKESGIRDQMRITVILPSGIVAGDSEEDPQTMDTHIDRPEVIDALKNEVAVSTRYSLTQKRNMIYLGFPLNKEGRFLGILRISMPFTIIHQTIKEIQTDIFLIGVLVLFISAIISLLLSRRISRPLEEIKHGAEKFMQGNFVNRLPDYDSVEIGSLSDTMNQMALKLSDQIKTMTRQRNELETVFSSMVEGVIAVDRDEKIISINHAATQIFNCDQERIKGRSVQEAIRNIELQQFVKKSLNHHRLLEEDIHIFSSEERILNGHGTALTDMGGKIIGALIVLSDVTRLRNLETMRRDFVANVSHEIKTPLTAIKGFVQTLRDGAIKEPENGERFLGIIEKHVDRLSVIINDLLSLSRIEEEAEKQEIDLKQDRIKEVLRAAIQVCEPKAAEKKVVIEFVCENDLQAEINPALLDQAVVNLLDNAIKYSPENSTIHVEAEIRDHEIQIKVQDQGCGIDRNHLPRLFERFYRVDKARSRKLGGTGLGLAIVKHIIQAHHGQVSVESIPDKGSTFTLHIPM